MSHTPALAISRTLLRVLVYVNLAGGAAIAALLLASFVWEQQLMGNLGLPPSPLDRPLIWGMRGVAAVGLAAIPLNHIVLTRLLAMVDAVRAGDPFVLDNARRLQTIAWTLLGLEMLHLLIGAIIRGASTNAHPLEIQWSFSINAWLAILLTFVLARVFEHGTRMRTDLEGTV